MNAVINANLNTNFDIDRKPSLFSVYIYYMYMHTDMGSGLGQRRGCSRPEGGAQLFVSGIPIHSCLPFFGISGSKLGLGFRVVFGFWYPERPYSPIIRNRMLRVWPSIRASTLVFCLE